MLKEIVINFLRYFGADLVEYSHHKHCLARRMKLIETYGIDLLLDVGANTGQYAKQMRAIGYRGNLVSIEPLSDAFTRLEKAADCDTDWRVFNCALGEFDGETEINIAGNSHSSSMLAMHSNHLKAAPASKFVNTQVTKVHRLDTFWEEIHRDERNVWLKVDVQGFERNVLDGAKNSLKYIDVIQLEMSCVTLYEGELLYGGMCELLASLGYQLVAVEPGYSDPETGEMLQFDGIFHKIN